MTTFTNHEPRDVYWKAQCMFLLGEYHRAAHTIRVRGLEKTHLFCHYLAAECLLEAKEYQQAIELLNANESAETMSTTMKTLEAMEMEPGEAGDPTKQELMASIWLLKGKVLEAMDNRQLAMDSYIQALQLNVYCTEALDALTQHEMLMSWEEKRLMLTLPIGQQCSENEAKVVRMLYQSKMKKYYESDASVSRICCSVCGRLNSVSCIDRERESHAVHAIGYHANDPGADESFENRPERRVPTGSASAQVAHTKSYVIAVTCHQVIPSQCT